jgi:alkylation response protein AidB-like acyl-CoA dehydrogenase
MEDSMPVTSPTPPLTQLNEEEQFFYDTVRDFAIKKIKPLVRKMDDEATVDPSIPGQLFELGLMGIEIPEKFGGAETSFFMAILAVEAISTVDPSIAVMVDVQNTLVNNAFLRWGSDRLNKKYLPQLTSNKIGAYSLSEAGSGSDAFALTTHAKKDGESYVLNGRKLWTTNANEADIFIVFANVNPDVGYKGITAFIIER